MDEILSRLRRRKARSRERLAERGVAQRSLRESPILGMLYSAAALAAAVLLMPPSPADHLWAPQMLALALTWVGGRWLLTLVAPAVTRSNATLLLHELTVVAPLAGAWVIESMAPNAAPPHAAAALRFAAPLTFAPLLMTLLFDAPAGLAAGAISGLALSVMRGFDPQTLALALASALVCCRFAQAARTRTRVIRIAAGAALAQLPVVAVAILQDSSALPPVSHPLRALSVVAGSLGGAAAALALLPVIERLFHRTSDIRLMAFADLGHPLLQRLALEAPGTYHHSLLVANLAQAAADRVGADGLLARVGCYFHDIGKLSRPQFFAENQGADGNPHDDLPPNLSRMIITNHVKEGVCLAQLHGLPPPVLACIREHHGTSVITWFHDKARAQQPRRRGRPRNAPAPADEVVEESHYRYGGPLPATREATIVSLADAIEAASRSLARVTPAHLENLVSTIVERKLLDGQLDASPLSFHELSAVKTSFVFTLTHLLHARIAYPGHAPHDSQPPASVPTALSAAS